MRLIQPVCEMVTTISSSSIRSSMVNSPSSLVTSAATHVCRPVPDYGFCQFLVNGFTHDDTRVGMRSLETNGPVGIAANCLEESRCRIGIGQSGPLCVMFKTAPRSTMGDGLGSERARTRAINDSEIMGASGRAGGLPKR